jgi:hypothetical protein
VSEAELSRRLALWANARRLSELDAASIRAHVLASETTVAEHAFDADRLWSLLRSVTELAEVQMPNVIERWLEPLSTAGTYQPYLRLA